MPKEYSQSLHSAGYMSAKELGFIYRLVPTGRYTGVPPPSLATTSASVQNIYTHTKN